MICCVPTRPATTMWCRSGISRSMPTNAALMKRGHIFSAWGARSQHASGSCPRRLRNWTPLPGCRSCAISSRQDSPLWCHSIWSSGQSAAMISRTGSARTVWSFTPTFSSRTSDGAGCCIYRIMPASSRMISSWSCANWTAA